MGLAARPGRGVPAVHDVHGTPADRRIRGWRAGPEPVGAASPGRSRHLRGPRRTPASGSCAGSEPPSRRCSRRRPRGELAWPQGGPFGLPFPSLYSCEHDVTGEDLEQPFRADGRKLTKERRYAPTSVHVRRIRRSRSPDLAFNFTGMCSHAEASTGVRVGLGRFTTEEDIDVALGAFTRAVGG